MRGPSEALLASLSAQGWAARITSSDRIADLRSALDALRAAGLLDSRLEADYLSGFDFSGHSELPQMRSMVVVVVPAPLFYITVRTGGVARRIDIPPTYSRYQETKTQVVETATRTLAGFGYRAIRAPLPEKIAAVRIGLARYGRNNIAYAPGMGSFAHPMVLLSDLPTPAPLELHASKPAESAPFTGPFGTGAPHDTWGEPMMLERCQDCVACRRACPTQAIDQDRFLLHAERCLTFFNENEDDIPGWVDPRAHNSLIGCMICQRVCPEDREALAHARRLADFDEEETARLVSHTPIEDLPQTTAVKVRRLALLGHYEIWTRNLELLLRQD